MANIISGQIIAIGQTQTIAPKNGQGNTLIKREFVIRALRFNQDDGTPELSEFNTPSLEINGEDKVGVLDGFKIGDVVRVSFTVEGRSYEDQNHNVRYFNSIRAGRIERMNINLPMSQSQQSAAPQPQQGAQQQNLQGTMVQGQQQAQAPQGGQQIPQQGAQQAPQGGQQSGVRYNANGNVLPF